MATLLDPADPEVRAAVDAGREIFGRLRAQPFLGQLEAVAAHSIHAEALRPPAQRRTSFVTESAGRRPAS
jgi:hypothetical protein